MNVPPSLCSSAQRRIIGLLVLSFCLDAAAAVGDEPEGFYVGSVASLEFDRPAEMPVRVAINTARIATTPIWTPGAESIVFVADRFRRTSDTWNRYDGHVVAIRGRAGQVVRGKLMLDFANGPRAVGFGVTLKPATDDLRKAFWNPWRSHFATLTSKPGAAWFRHQVRRADAALKNGGAVTNVRRQREFFGSRMTSADDTLALMSGGRAVSENLQLDREIPIRGAESKAVSLDSVKGITVREFDWKPLIKDLKPREDPLASMIPADQHALFVPSFTALVTLVDEATKNGVPLLRIAAPQSDDARSRERYERQLCLGLNAASRLIGPQLIDSVAMTGGDAYLRTGTDVAVLMETTNPKALRQLLGAQQKLVTATAKDVAKVSGTILGIPYEGVRTPSREICSYIATLEGAVVVTNSLVQLERLISTSQQPDFSLLATDEYTFFRSRYQQGDEHETGLVILSDATIRRWCSPKWRIGASRRTRVAAAMAEVQAQHMNDLVTGGIEEQQIVSDSAVARGEPFMIRGQQINSDQYGDLTFLTPISELELTSISQEEAQMYRRWRDGYQRAWSNYFDPIAVHFSIKGKVLEADLTVMPLIAQSSYRQLQEISRGSALNKGVGDPHPEAMLQWMLALNPDSQQLKLYTGFLKALAPQIRVDPLAWLGNGISFYVDKDPLWKEAMDAEDPDDFFEKNVHHLPVALHVEVKNSLQLTLFMAGLRAYIEQTVPGVTLWEPQTHKEGHYVKVSATDRAGVPNSERFHLYYAASGEGLTFSLSERVIQKALERRLARRKQAGAEGEQDAKKDKSLDLRWPNQNVAMRVSREGLRVIEELLGHGYREEMRRMSFNNLPILNEWKRLFPELDPVEVHEDFWQVRLVCPSGGKYAWNDELKTMESTVYGSPLNVNKDKGPGVPAALKSFATGEFGIEFEENGLRSHIRVERK